MKKFFLIFLFICSGLALAQTQNPPLADRHSALGMTSCATCHESATPALGATAAMERCLTCHESYEKITVRTVSYGDYNPHKSHIGEPECNACHKGHAQSASYCVACHEGLEQRMK